MKTGGLDSMLTIIAALTLAAGRTNAESNGSAREAVRKALPVIEASIAEYPKHNSCFSCHHQGAPMVALAIARENRGKVSQEAIGTISRLTQGDLRNDVQLYRDGKGQPGGVERAGYALWTLKAAGVARNELTDSVAAFLLTRDESLNGPWNSASSRPPSESSSFTSTFVAVQALRTYGDPARAADIERRIGLALRWIRQKAHPETEDSVFRLWGLREAGGSEEEVTAAARELLSQQLADGGWAQRLGMDSDAYATGSVLVALRKAGRIQASDTGWQRGIRWLIKNQLPDGTWHVVSRSKPFQPYFESGFPHGKDQFISMAASSWALAALAMTTNDRAAAWLSEDRH